MKDTYKCGYSKCKLGGIVNKEQAIKDKNKYYHKECLEELQNYRITHKQDIENKIKIRDLFLDKVNKSEVVGALVGIINNIIDKKGISSEYLLYALNYQIKHKLPLNHAAGLYYIINNDSIKKSYEQYKSKKIQTSIDSIKTTEELKFKTNINHNQNWNKILE